MLQPIVSPAIRPIAAFNPSPWRGSAEQEALTGFNTREDSELLPVLSARCGHRYLRRSLVPGGLLAGRGRGNTS
jgi:hypothetical protein